MFDSVCVSLVIALVIVTNKSDLNTNNKEGSSELKSEVKTCMTEGCIGRLYLYTYINMNINLSKMIEHDFMTKT